LILSFFVLGSDIGQFFKLKNIKEVFRKVPLPEDVTLKGLPVLKSSHDVMDWKYLHHNCLHAKEEVNFIVLHKEILRLSWSDLLIEIVVRSSMFIL
jgi:hypothetical protein